VECGAYSSGVAPENGTGIFCEVYPVEFVYEAPKEHSSGRAVLNASPQSNHSALDMKKSFRSTDDVLRALKKQKYICDRRLATVVYRGEQLPIDFIFDTPIKREIRGFPVYTTGFNLSS